jgi:hypothetical protein
MRAVLLATPILASILISNSLAVRAEPLAGSDAEQQKLDEALDKKLNICRC